MAKKVQAQPAGALPLEEATMHSIAAPEGFDYGGAHYSAGIHNDLPADLARAIVAAGKATLCERPAPREEGAAGAGEEEPGEGKPGAGGEQA